MAAPSYTYTLTNGTTADASEVQQNFTDILNGISDGTKDLSINALTVAGTATLNGDVNLGNATGDSITVTGRFASSLVPSTSAANDLGTSSLCWQHLYLDNGATDGGTIYFNGGTSQYLQCSADGTEIDIGGFSSVDLGANTILKVDTINDRAGTGAPDLSNGAKIESGLATSGALSASGGTGYLIGETIAVEASAVSVGASYTSLGSLTFTRGVWLVAFSYYASAGTTGTQQQLYVRVGTSAGSSTAVFGTGLLDALTEFDAILGTPRMTLHSSLVLRCDGTNLVGTDGTSTANLTLYANAYNFKGTGQFNGVFYAVRIGNLSA